MEFFPALKSAMIIIILMETDVIQFAKFKLDIIVLDHWIPQVHVNHVKKAVLAAIPHQIALHAIVLIY